MKSVAAKHEAATKNYDKAAERLAYSSFDLSKMVAAAFSDRHRITEATLSGNMPVITVFSATVP